MTVRVAARWYVLALSISLVFAGCNNVPETPAPETPAPDAGDNAAGGEDAMADEDPAVTEALKDLSAEDQAAVRRQKTCPVGGGLLGSMGPPIKVDVKGQDVYICCAGCEQELLARADEYLAKINADSSADR